MNHSILVELARALTIEEFSARLPEPALVVVSELDTDGATGDEDTQVGDELAGVPRPASSSSWSSPPAVPQRFETLPVRKKRHGADPSRISIGRGRTCDIVVRTPGISKLHACFLPEQPLRLVDCRSQNGTFLDGDRLRPDEPVSVRTGQLLTFGDLQTQLVSPEVLYGLLKRSSR